LKVFPWPKFSCSSFQVFMWHKFSVTYLIWKFSCAWNFLWIFRPLKCLLRRELINNTVTELKLYLHELFLCEHTRTLPYKHIQETKLLADSS
jgi:hypothetical protein